MSHAAQLYPRTYYPYLDGFRALSILWVLLHHIYVFFDLSEWTAAAWLPAVLSAKLGLLGVDMFFVISGFLITGLLLPDLDGHIRIKRFYLRRIFKIVPSYLAAVAGGLLMLWLIGDRMLIDYGNFRIISGQAVAYRELIPQPFDAPLLARYFIFLQNYADDHIVTLAHTWSIAIEEHFYLGYPLLLWIACRAGTDFASRRRWIVALLILFFAAAQIYRYIHIAQWHSLNNQATPARIDALITGCLIRIAEPYLRGLPQRARNWLATVCFTGGALLYTSLFTVTSHQLTTGIKSVSGGLFYYTGIYAAPALLILAALLDFRPVTKILSHRLLIAIGKHSYGTYLWHYVLIFPFALLQDRYPAGLLILLYVPTSLLAGYISTETLERHFLELRRRVCP